MLVTVRLASPSLVVPRPGVPGAILPQGEPFEVPAADVFFAALLRDGTLIREPEAEAPPKPAKAKA